LVGVFGKLTSDNWKRTDLERKLYFGRAYVGTEKRLKKIRGKRGGDVWGHEPTKWEVLQKKG